MIKNFHPWLRFLLWKDGLAMRNAAFLQRRPHRSFRRTRRRDYARSLKLPGYWSFTAYVWKYVWKRKRTFGLLILFYAAAAMALGSIASQSTYQQISDLLNKSVGEVIQGTWGSVGQAGVLLAATFLSPAPLTPEQQIYVTLAAVFIWLTTVWLLRNMMAGGKPKLRDGLYSAGSPLIASLIVVLVAIVQLIPLALAALAYAGLSTYGLLDEGLGMMIYWVFCSIIGIMVLYWMVSTFLALVIVTLPGMYPFNALKAAGDIVVGRRLRILYRLLWLAFTVALGWVIVMIPAVLLDTGIKNLWPAIKGAPIVPVLAAFMASASLVWTAAYIYMLYRKIVDDDASPA